MSENKQNRRREDTWHVSRTINVGEIITVIALVVTVGLAYTRLESRVLVLEQDKAHISEQLAEIRVLVDRMNSKLDGAILREIERGKSH